MLDRRDFIPELAEAIKAAEHGRTYQKPYVHPTRPELSYHDPDPFMRHGYAQRGYSNNKESRDWAKRMENAYIDEHNRNAALRKHLKRIIKARRNKSRQQNNIMHNDILFRLQQKVAYEDDPYANRFVGGGNDEIQDIENIFDQYKAISLSNKEIEKLLDGKCKIVTYPELARIESIDEVLEPFGCFILLYLTKANYGHWCAVIKHNDKIEFFDPYGGKSMPDEELKQIPEHFRQRSNQDYPHLSALLYDSGYPIEYNNFKFQKHLNGTNTCGRHCAVRCSTKNLSLNDYHQYINDLCKEFNLDPDSLVTLLTLRASQN